MLLERFDATQPGLMTDSQVALVLSGVSIAVAVLSLLWSAAWSIWLYRKTHRPALRVQAAGGLAATSDGVLELVSVAVANTGTVPLTLTSLAFRVCDDKERRQVVPREWLHAPFLPCRLDVGALAQAPHAEREGIRRTLAEAFPQDKDDAMWRLVAVAGDAAGARWESVPFTV